MIEPINTKLDVSDCLILAALVAVAAWMSGCGFAIIPVPQSAGERISLVKEARINSVLETGIETAAEEQIRPVYNWYRRAK